MTFSPGLVDHFKCFLPSELWPKLTYLYPAVTYPSGSPDREHEDFTILTVGNRYSDKGIPEALDAYAVLRQRHGELVRMILVCGDLPTTHRIPEGVIHYRSRMNKEVRTAFFRAADVFLLPNYWDSAGALMEACAFGVPAVTARIHHDETFVLHERSGYLVEAPLFAYSEGYGTRWRNLHEFRADIASRRERGGLRSVVEEASDRIEGMLSGSVDRAAMSEAALRLHAERFSPEVHNDRLRSIYARALDGSDQTVIHE